MPRHLPWRHSHRLLRRFRPNILIGGAIKPYDEDDWAQFTFGKSAGFRQLGLTGRCVIPTTSPVTGVRDDDEEPRNTMLDYRLLPYGTGVHGGPTLGIWVAPCTSDETKFVRVGDRVTNCRYQSKLWPHDHDRLPASLSVKLINTLII